jgi:hypothetical protein
MNQGAKAAEIERSGHLANWIELFPMSTDPMFPSGKLDIKALVVDLYD